MRQPKTSRAPKPSPIEYYAAGRKTTHGVKVWHVNTGFFKEKLHGLFKKPGDSPGTLHLHGETTQAFLDQATAENYDCRKPKKGRGGRGKWTWEPKSEGKPNHYLDTIVGAFVIADMKNYRGLATRELLAARRSQVAAAQPKPTVGVRTPDGRPFFATQRR